MTAWTDSRLPHGLRDGVAVARARTRLRWTAGVAWWMAGLRATVPPSWLSRLATLDRPLLAVRPDKDGPRATWVRAPDGAAHPPAALDGDVVSWLAERGYARQAVTVGLVMDRSALFTRDMKVPEEALPSLPSLLDHELALRTPFLAEEVWHAAAVYAARGRTRAVTHWIVRRDHVARAARLAGLSVDDVDVIMLAVPDGPPKPVIGLRAPQATPLRGSSPALGRVVIGAALVTALVLVGADGLETSRAARMADSLAQMRARLDGDATASREVRSLLALAGQPGLGQIWAELSRILPDSAFLTDVSVADGTLTVTGHARDPAALVRLIDASPLFARATLTGAIEPTPDGRNRFTLAADLRGRSASAARGRDP